MIRALNCLRGAGAHLLSELSPGAWFNLDRKDYLLVTVTGQTPAAGRVFAHSLEDAKVVQLDGTKRATLEYLGTYQQLMLAQACPANGISLASVPISTLTPGAVFDTGATTTPPGRLGRVVTVLAEDGTTPLPGRWRLFYDTATVESVADATVVESYGASAVTGYTLNP